MLGIETDEERCRELLYGSLVTVTALNPDIICNEAASVSKIALKTRREISKVALSVGVMTEAELTGAFTTDNLLSARKQALLKDQKQLFRKSLSTPAKSESH